MLKDELGVFLVEISKMFPVDNKRDYDSIIKQTLEYLWEYCKGKDISLTDAKRYIFDNYSYKSFPEPSFFKETLKNNIIYKETTETISEEKRMMLLILPDGYIYEFRIDDGFTPEQIEQFRKEKIKKHGDKTQVNVYPKGSTIIGNKVFIPVKPEKEGEEEKNKIVEIA
jgi:hypothetical protein